jgi:hypothetical protein
MMHISTNYSAFMQVDKLGLAISLAISIRTCNLFGTILVYYVVAGMSRIEQAHADDNDVAGLGRHR